MSDESETLEARLESTNCSYGKYLLYHVGTFLLGWFVGSHLLETLVKNLVG